MTLQTRTIVGCWALNYIINFGRVKTIAWLMNHLLGMLEDDNLVKIYCMSRIESPRSQPPPQVQAKPQAKPRPDIPKELSQIEPQVKQQPRSSASKGSRVDIKA